MSEPTLHKQHHPLADPLVQRQILSEGLQHKLAPVPFQQKLEASELLPLRPQTLQVLQINLGKMCNQTCHHCHVDAGPDRKEIMSRETMQLCLEVLQAQPGIHTVDLTGGAPEMNPDFRWFVRELQQLGRHILVRCNLTIIVANKKHYDLPLFFREHGVEVISSLPCYTADTTNRQRGDGVFEKSIRALQLLNAAGYGVPDTGLILNLVYNPNGAFLPPDQQLLQQEYQRVLKQSFGIVFNQLITITNMPISRYLDYLLSTGSYESYMALLVQAYNPAAAARVMCRQTLSVGWDGSLYDCDFNQMLALPVACSSRHLSNFEATQLQERNIAIGQHCYGCTAGHGSSCSGAVV